MIDFRRSIFLLLLCTCLSFAFAIAVPPAPSPSGCGVLQTPLTGIDTLRYCAGDSLLLDAGTGWVSYAWSTGDSTPSITVSTPGSYWFHIIDTAGCTLRDTVVVEETGIPFANLSPASGAFCLGDSFQLFAGGGTSYSWYLNGVQIPGVTGATYFASQPGDYTIIATDPPGCSDSLTAAVPLQSILPPMINLGPDQSLCFGDTLTFTVSGSFNFVQWCNYPPGPTISVDTPGTYCVAVTDANNCTGRDTLELLPSTTVASYTFSQSQLDVQFTDASTNALSYSWDFGDGNTSTTQNPMHSYAGNGTYLACLQVVGNDGCKMTFCDTVVINLVSRTARDGYRIDVYPQPASDMVRVRIHGSSHGITACEVFDLQGRQVLPAILNGVGAETVDLKTDALGSGYYFLRMKIGEAEVWRKFNVLR